MEKRVSSASFTISAVKDGKAGHVGRWYYYADEWASDATYTMQETQAPFVKRGDSFYMLDFGTKGVETGESKNEDPATNYNPVSGQGTKPWTLMQSTMQYYIAQAFFGPYAHFGSFIINGDWMISQYGTLVDSSGTRITVNADNVSLQYGGKIPYAWFDPSDPTVSTNPQSGYKFAPNFAVDGLTGKTYQNDAYVKGEIHATSGEFRGVVRATNFFHSVAISGSYTVGFCNNDFLDEYSEEPWIGNFTYGGYYTEEEARQLSSENVGIGEPMVKCTGAADIVVIKATGTDTDDITVTLPRAQDYEGKIVEIVDTRYTQPSSQLYVGSLYVRQCDNASCMKGNFAQSISISDQLTLNGNYEHNGGSYRLMSYKEGRNYYWVKLGTS